MENLIVGTIVGLAVFFFARGLYRSFKPEEDNACGCGCSGCGQSAACDQLPKRETECLTECK